MAPYNSYNNLEGLCLVGHGKKRPCKLRGMATDHRDDKQKSILRVTTMIKI